MPAKPPSPVCPTSIIRTVRDRSVTSATGGSAGMSTVTGPSRPTRDPPHGGRGPDGHRLAPPFPLDLVEVVPA